MKNQIKSSRDLQNILYEIDHSGYPAYKKTRGSYRFDEYVLTIGRVQSDPFAPPSKLSVTIPASIAKIPSEYYNNSHRRTAAEDVLLRNFSRQLNSLRDFKDDHQNENKRKGHGGRDPSRGSGKSGLVSTTRPGQEILKRSAVEISANGDVTLRFEVGFPARGRTIQVSGLIDILFERLPDIVKSAAVYSGLDQRKLKAAVDLSDDQAYIREQLKPLGLVAFIADGSILPRESGVSGRPMKNAVAFKAPEENSVEIDLPHAGRLRGMGIKKGITLIVGGGYHGKSTLLGALEKGVYNHIKGDGREYCITDDTAVKLRAEDGRSIKSSDISMFIDCLPNGKDTVSFDTEDASGSTSQAANVIESIEAGASVMLIDEDTSATNFMVRDELMQQVVSPDQEPITPFISRIRDLYDIHEISTVLVAGSSGAFFNVADEVIRMDAYIPSVITVEAKEKAQAYRHATLPAKKELILPAFNRIPGKVSELDRDPRGPKTKVMGRESFSINKETVDVRGLEQLVDREQTAALASILAILATQIFDGRKNLTEAVDELEKKLSGEGLSYLFGDSFVTPGLAMPRRIEIFGCVNRYRKLRIRAK